MQTLIYKHAKLFDGRDKRQNYLRDKEKVNERNIERERGKRKGMRVEESE